MLQSGKGLDPLLQKGKIMLDFKKILLRNIDNLLDDIEKTQEKQKVLADELLKNLETIDKLMNSIED